MDKQTPGVPQRAKSRSSVATPNIALELERTVACCKMAADAMSPYPGLTLSDLTTQVGETFATTTTGESDIILAERLSSLVFAHVKSSLARSEAELAELADLLPYFRSDKGQLAALAVLGLKGDLSPAYLARTDHPGARLVERIRSLCCLSEWIVEGGLVKAVVDLYQATTTDAALNDVIAHHTVDGIDAESLTWALIVFETNRHVKLVWHFANKLTRSFPERDSADLFGWGWQGLRVALRGFEPARNLQFSTYAATRIQGSIRDGVRSENPVPKRLTTFHRKYDKGVEELTHQLNRVPSLIEVSDHLGENLDQLRIIPRLAPAASIDEIREMTRDAAPSWLVENDDPADHAVASLCAEDIQEALSGIPEDDATAVRLLVMEALDPREAREITGATARQMRLRRDRGLAALSTKLAERGWGELADAL